MMNQQNQPWNQNQNPQFGSRPQNTAPLTDQELAFDLLYQEKALMANITSDVLEASHQGIRQVLNDTYMQMGQDQLQIFQLMQQNGWYQTKPAPQPELQTAKQKYQQMRQGL